MTLAALIRKRDTGDSATAIPAIPATQAGSGRATVARIATIAVANPQEAENHAPDPAAEARRRKVLAMLAANPALRIAVVCDGDGDGDGDGDPVPVAIAIRDKGACELLVPRDRYDGVLLLDLIERHSGTVH